MGDVGAFDALIGKSNICIFVKGFFAPQCTTACIFPIYGQRPTNLSSAVTKIVDGQIADYASRFTNLPFSTGGNNRYFF